MPLKELKNTIAISYFNNTSNDKTLDPLIKGLTNMLITDLTGTESVKIVERERIDELLKENYEVTLETGGSLPICNVPEKVIKIVDFKCPSSGMKKKNLWSIVDDLQIHDEVKFVIGNREDYEWTKEKITEYFLNEKCTVLVSPIFNKIDPKIIVEWILADSLPVRMQIQIHKYIWNPGKGV